MRERPAQFADLLRVLDAHGVEYVLVGALAAALHGAPVSTYDIDIVHRREPDNVARLVEALHSTHAFYWEHTDRRLDPEARTLLLPGHHRLRTDLGHLDVLDAIGAGQGFDELQGRTSVITVGPDLAVRVLDLEAIIETKRAVGRPKDLAALPTLEQALAELRRAAAEPPVEFEPSSCRGASRRAL